MQMMGFILDLIFTIARVPGNALISHELSQMAAPVDIYPNLWPSNKRPDPP